MNYGPLLFLAAFFALAGSWFGFVLTPQAQIGQLQPANLPGTAISYPQGRPGLARQGLEVYRANGCADCHTQQVRQNGTACSVLLSDAGTNAPAVLAALRSLKPGLSEAEAGQWLSGLPKPVLEGLAPAAADAAAKALTTNGGKAAVWIVPVGPEIARGWGKRRTVARDFLFDYPVMLGSQRIGPDLANVSLRQPDPIWHLRHLYKPRLEVRDSTMPSYRFLFEKRKIQRCPSPDALVLPGSLAPPPGYEIVPRPEARALAAYLASLRADAPLFEAPLSLAAPPATAPTVATNGPAAATTAANAAPTGAPGN